MTIKQSGRNASNLGPWILLSLGKEAVWVAAKGVNSVSLLIKEIPVLHRAGNFIRGAVLLWKKKPKSNLICTCETARTKQGAAALWLNSSPRVPVTRKPTRTKRCWYLCQCLTCHGPSWILVLTPWQGLSARGLMAALLGACPGIWVWIH